MYRRFLILAALTLGILTLASPAHATASSTITLDQTAPHVGDTVTFTATFVGNPMNYDVRGLCVQTDAPGDWTLTHLVQYIAPMSVQFAATTGITLAYADTSQPAKCAIELDKLTGNRRTAVGYTAFCVDATLDEHGSCV